MTNPIDFSDIRAVRAASVQLAAEAAGKTRFNADKAITDAVKIANFISDGTVPEPDPTPARKTGEGK